MRGSACACGREGVPGKQVRFYFYRKFKKISICSAVTDIAAAGTTDTFISFFILIYFDYNHCNNRKQK